MSTDTQSALKRFSENCMLVSIRVGVAGQTYTSDRASNDAAMVNNANINRIKTSVLKFTNADLKPCRKERDDAKALLNAVTVPWNSNGERIVQVKTYQNIKSRLRNHRAKFFDYRDEFIRSYSTKVDSAREELTYLFDENRFPNPDEVSGQFSFDIKTDVITDPEDIRITGTVELIEEVREEMQQRQVRKLNDSKQDFLDRLIDRLKKTYGSVSNLHEKKEAGEDTKFFDSAITGVVTLCDTLSDINITKDPELEDFGNQLEQTFGGLDITMIKESPTVREEVLETTGSILEALENYKPTAFKA